MTYAPSIPPMDLPDPENVASKRDANALATTTRYECRHKMDAGSRAVFHKSGYGKPRSKRCTYCGGGWFVEDGVHGVFQWRGDGRYALADAVKTFSREVAAERYANAENDRASYGERNLVVRWVPIEGSLRLVEVAR